MSAPLDSNNFTKSNIAPIMATFETHQLLSNKNTLMAFTGHFDHLLTTLLLVNVKNKLSVMEASTGIDKRVYSILVECIENVSKHCLQANSKDDIATFLLAKSDDKYTIVTGNHIMNSDIPILKSKLDKVAASNHAELKQMYRDQILSKRTEENCAGLGLIDIAIKSGNQIKYEFLPLTENTTFYILQTEINIQK
jgi:hypothetical protein